MEMIRVSNNFSYPKCTECANNDLTINQVPCRDCRNADLFELKSYQPTKEMVNHPSHYNKGKYEVIDVIYDWNLNFSLGSALKYIARAEYKDKPVEDLKKAIQYIEFEIKEREKECDD